jgi:periplasmic protein TonB
MPKPSPTVAPTPQQAVRMTSTMLQGKAVKRVQPPYPQIAKIGRISGAVQVQVMISEDGTVDSASVLSGHPLLRDASVQAARQWVFSPTILNGQPVRVVGILTFNFTLN